MKKKRYKIALVHDYLRTFGGGERVLIALIKLYPNADIFVASANYENTEIYRYFGKIKNRIYTSWVNSFMLFRKKPILYRVLLPYVWKYFDFSSYDFVISSSGSNIAHGIFVPSHIPHICYCHTPPRYLNGFSTETNIENSKLIKILIEPIKRILQNYAYSSASRVTRFISNSTVVRKRISHYFHRKAIVIYPPIIFERISLDQLQFAKRNYYLVVSRQVNNKNLEIIMKTFTKMNKKLVVVGSGKQFNHLRQIATPNITLTGFISDRILKKYYINAKALVVASENEDFGLTVVEAMSCGTPAIALYSGGYKETVIENTTGIFFHHLSVKSLEGAIDKFESVKFNPIICWQQARRYSQQNFQDSMRKIVNECIKPS